MPKDKMSDNLARTVTHTDTLPQHISETIPLYITQPIGHTQTHTWTHVLTHTLHHVLTHTLNHALVHALNHTLVHTHTHILTYIPKTHTAAYTRTHTLNHYQTLLHILWHFVRIPVWPYHPDSRYSRQTICPISELTNSQNKLRLKYFRQIL